MCTCYTCELSRVTKEVVVNPLKEAVTQARASLAVLLRAAAGKVAQ